MTLRWTDDNTFMSINSCLLVLYNRTQVKIQVYEYDKRNIAYRRKMTQTKN